MKFTDNIVKNFGIDKLLHFLIGGWIVSMFSPFGGFEIILGFIIILILSFIKEYLFDDNFDKNDIIASCIGGTAAVIIYFILKLIL